MFFKRKKLLKLLDSLHSESWSADSFEDNEEFVSSLKSLKLTYQLYVVLTATCSSSFYLERYVTDGRKLAFNLPFFTYWPQFVPFHVLLAYEVLVGYALVIPIFSMDVLMLTILSLTDVQFRLLNRECTNMFSRSEKMETGLTVEKIRRCNEHLSFLLR